MNLVSKERVIAKPVKKARLAPHISKADLALGNREGQGLWPGGGLETY